MIKFHNDDAFLHLYRNGTVDSQGGHDVAAVICETAQIAINPRVPVSQIVNLPRKGAPARDLLTSKSLSQCLTRKKAP